MSSVLGADFRIMVDCFPELPDSCFPHFHLDLLFPFPCYFWLPDLNAKLSSVFWVWVPTVPSKAGAPGNRFQGTVWEQTTQPLPSPLCWAQHELEGWIPSLSFRCCSPAGQPQDPVRIYGLFWVCYPRICELPHLSRLLSPPGPWCYEGLMVIGSLSSSVFNLRVVVILCNLALL